MWLNLGLAQSGPFQLERLASRRGNEKAVPGQVDITFMVDWELTYIHGTLSRYL